MANKRTPSCLSYNGSSATGSLSNKQPRPATRHPRHFPHSPDFATKPLLDWPTHHRRRNTILPVGMSAPANNFFVGTGPTRGKPPQRRPKAAKTQLDASSANPWTWLRLVDRERPRAGVSAKESPTVGQVASFLQQPRAVTVKLEEEPESKCPKAVPRPCTMWSRALKCSVKSCVTGSSTKNYFNEFLFTVVRTHDKISYIKWLWEWSERTLNYWMMVERYSNLKEEVGGSNLPAVKSPLYLTKNLSGGQLPHVLWCWPVRLLSRNNNKKLRDFEVPWSPGFMLGLLPRGRF